MVHGETGAVQHEVPARVERLSVHLHIFLHQGSLDEHRYVVLLYVPGSERYHGDATAVRREFRQKEHPAETRECNMVWRSVKHEYTI